MSRVIMIKGNIMDATDDVVVRVNDHNLIGLPKSRIACFKHTVIEKKGSRWINRDLAITEIRGNRNGLYVANLSYKRRQLYSYQYYHYCFYQAISSICTWMMCNSKRTLAITIHNCPCLDLFNRIVCQFGDIIVTIYV